MTIQTITGSCLHIEIDGEEGITHATFVFKTPSVPDTLGNFIKMLALGIEVASKAPFAAGELDEVHGLRPQNASTHSHSFSCKDCTAFRSSPA